jgi:hypothetical protein
LSALAVAAGSGCPGLEAFNPLCQAASLGGSVAGDGINAVLSGLSQWVASGAEWLLRQIGNVLISTTSINVGAKWFHVHYVAMTALAGVVVLPLLLLSVMQAVYRQNAGQLVRTFFLQLPLALLMGVVAVQIVQLCLSATDAMSAAVAGTAGSDITALLSGVTKGLITAVGDPTMATFVLLLVGLLVAAAAFVLWLELLVRAAAVYVAVLFLPLALATLVWPAISHWCRRLVETLAALILSKLVIVATLSLAAGALASGTAGTGDAGAGFASVLEGGALLVLATFVPFAILRLIPAIEAGAVGHLEGVRQRSTAAMTRVPRTAASYALNGGLEARGAARLLAQAGPVGTSKAGGAGGFGSGGSGVEEEGNWENGGCIPGEDGMMRGIPGTGESWFWTDWEERQQQPKGPAPILPAPAYGREQAGDHEVPPVKYIGKPGPNDRKYTIETDDNGLPFIHYVRGTGPSYGPRPEVST